MGHEMKKKKSITALLITISTKSQIHTHAELDASILNETSSIDGKPSERVSDAERVSDSQTAVSL